VITALIDLMGTFYQAGNPGQMAVIARSMLTTIPGDLVALQFLGLALYQLGQTEAAHRIFRRVAERTEAEAQAELPTTIESAAVTNYREATRPASGLAEAWYVISAILSRYGFHKAAERAFQASRIARGPAALPRILPAAPRG
jgi:tetratricopeptide (TPR) repeat protein